MTLATFFRTSMLVLLVVSMVLAALTGPGYLARIERRTPDSPGVRCVHELRVDVFGPETIHAGMHIEAGLT